MQQAEQIFQMMVKMGLHPDAVTFQILTKGHCSANNFDDALQLVERMKAYNIDMSKNICDTLIYHLAIGKKFYKAMEMLDQLLPNNSVDKFTCTCLVKELCETKKLRYIEDSLRVIKKMKAHNIPRDTALYNPIIRGMFEINEISKAMDVISAMRDDGIECNSFTIGSMITDWGSLKRPDLAFKLLLESPKKYGVPITIINFNAVLFAFYINRQADETIKLFEDLMDSKYENLTPNVNSFTIAMKAYTTRKRYDEAINLLDIMEKEKIRGDLKLFSTCLECFLSADMPEQVEKIWDSMERSKIKPSQHILKKVVKFLCRHERLDKVKSILKDKEAQVDIMPGL